MYGLAMDTFITLVGALIALPMLSYATYQVVALVHSTCSRLVWKQGKPRTAQKRCRWNDNIKSDDREIGSDDVNFAMH
jgi:hypothetical protein